MTTPPIDTAINDLIRRAHDAHDGYKATALLDLIEQMRVAMLDLLAERERLTDSKFRLLDKHDAMEAEIDQLKVDLAAALARAEASERDARNLREALAAMEEVVVCDPTFDAAYPQTRAMVEAALHPASSECWLCGVSTPHHHSTAAIAAQKEGGT